jgi:hypothetical protein
MQVLHIERVSMVHRRWIIDYRPELVWSVTLSHTHPQTHDARSTTQTIKWSRSTHRREIGIERVAQLGRNANLISNLRRPPMIRGRTVIAPTGQMRTAALPTRPRRNSPERPETGERMPYSPIRSLLCNKRDHCELDRAIIPRGFDAQNAGRGEMAEPRRRLIASRNSGRRSQPPVLILRTRTPHGVLNTHDPTPSSKRRWRWRHSSDGGRTTQNGFLGHGEGTTGFLRRSGGVFVGEQLHLTSRPHGVGVATAAPEEGGRARRGSRDARWRVNRRDDRWGHEYSDRAATRARVTGCQAGAGRRRKNRSRKRAREKGRLTRGPAQQRAPARATRR